MICQLLAPIERDASTTPRSTSFAEDSTMRATKGKAETVSGTMVAGEPTVVPITRRVRGLRKNSSSMKNTSTNGVKSGRPENCRSLVQNFRR